VDKQMGFKSRLQPDELFEEISDYLWENKMQRDEDEKKYRLKVQIMDEEEEEVCRIKFQIEFL
jgi:hypothetical protein